MSWVRASAIAALVQAIQVTAGETVTVYGQLPETVNPPAIVVGRPSEVLYSSPAFGIDTATIPVFCVGARDGDDVIDGLITKVRAAVSPPADLTLAHVVQLVGDVAERGWRNFNVAGIDVLQAQVDLSIQM